ncbi:MAG: host specificity protein, partial [Rhodobacterales bacterium 17-64-5]
MRHRPEPETPPPARGLPKKPPRLPPKTESSALVPACRGVLPGEEFGHEADGNHYFHLDPLWSDSAIDFIGIDNYMPLSDWRDGTDHLDAHWGSIYNIDYLKANVAGGEGYDWYYESPATAETQLRRPIQDLGYGEDWVYRYKDLAGWWGHTHHDRIGGTRVATASGWVPGMKPIRFTEYGCPALDKASNEPNRFIDPKSSESGLPRGSSGRRDDLIQVQYLRATHEFWSDTANNPAATLYAGRMIDLARCHVWAWDARPFPEFPGNAELWGDDAN